MRDPSIKEALIKTWKAFFLAIFAVFQLCGSQMVCPPLSPTTVYSLPEESCVESRLFLANVEKQSVGEFRTEIQTLDVFSSTCTTEYFFFGSYYSKVREIQLIPTEEEAKQYMMDSSPRLDPAPCHYMWPHTYTSSVLRFRKIPGTIFTLPGGDIRSPVGNFDNCKYESGFCVLSTGRVAWWTPSREYTKITTTLGSEEVEVFPGFLRSRRHQSDLRILTKNSSVITTEAGLTFTLIRPIKVPTVVNRTKRYSPESLHWEDVQSKLSYVLHGLDAVLQGSNYCTLQRTLGHFDVLVSSSVTTLWARRYLKNPYLIAQKSGRYLLVQECFQVSAKLAPLQDQCFRYPRVEFMFHHHQSIGFLHPETGVIHSSSPGIRCSRRLDIVEVNRKVYVLRGSFVTRPSVRNLTGDPWRHHPSGLTSHQSWWYGLSEMARADMSHEVVLDHDHRIRALEEEQTRAVPSTEKGISSLLDVPHVLGFWKLAAIKTWVLNIGSILGWFVFLTTIRNRYRPKTEAPVVVHATAQPSSVDTRGLSRSSYRRSIAWHREETSSSDEHSG